MMKYDYLIVGAGLFGAVFARQKALWKCCREINREHMKYPDTTYCRRITLPVRLRATVAIDMIAKRLLK